MKVLVIGLLALAVGGTLFAAAYVVITRGAETDRKAATAKREVVKAKVKADASQEQVREIRTILIRKNIAVPGRDGLRGARGPFGMPGPRGPAGPQGPMGVSPDPPVPLPGPAGEAGPQGERGEAGPDGAIGPGRGSSRRRPATAGS